MLVTTLTEIGMIPAHGRCSHSYRHRRRQNHDIILNLHIPHPGHIHQHGHHHDDIPSLARASSKRVAGYLKNCSSTIFRRPCTHARRSWAGMRPLQGRGAFWMLSGITEAQETPRLDNMSVSLCTMYGSRGLRK